MQGAVVLVFFANYKKHRTWSGREASFPTVGAQAREKSWSNQQPPAPLSSVHKAASFAIAA